MRVRHASINEHPIAKTSEHQDAALDRDRHRVGAIVCIKLGKYPFHVRLHRFLRDAKLSGRALVGGSTRHSSKYFDLTFAQSVIRSVLGNVCSDFRTDLPPARMHRADGLDQLFAQHVLEQESRSSSS